MLRGREAKMAKSSKKRNAGRKSLPQQRIDRMMEQPMSVSKTSSPDSPITKLAVELFQRVAVMLPALSIVSLSQVCRSFSSMLSTENGGNYVFYQALPAPLLMQRESFQATPETVDQVDEDVVMSDSFDGPPVTPPHRFSTIVTGCMTPGSVLRTPTTGFSCFSGLAISDPAVLTGRREALALGGPYDDKLDYREEILGFAEIQKCCRICFTINEGHAVKPMPRWGGVLCCGKCYRTYAISAKDLQDFGLDKDMVNRLVNTIGIKAIYKVKANSAPQYYRPSVDVVLRELHDTGVADLVLQKEIFMSERKLGLLAATKVEAQRRIVREAITKAAEQIWDGFDPYPAKIRNVRGEVVTSQTNPALPTVDQWKSFRDRFCPTSKLKEMLFPSAKVIDPPTSASVQKDHQWLYDSTMELKTQTDFNRLTPQWITATALDMLYQLVDYTDAHYAEDGHGGSITTWVEAAKDWHIERLDTELASGSVMAMQHITPAMRVHNDGMHRGIANLRERLGITRNPQHLQHVPEADKALIRSLFEKENRGSPTYRHNPTATEATVNKYFHRIIREACSRCPVSSFLFSPIGYEGLLEHMRSHHPDIFWVGNFHSLA